MRHFVLTLLTLTLSIQASLVSAQGPFGRGPGIGGIGPGPAGFSPGPRGIGPGPAGFGPRGIGPAALGPRAIGPGVVGRPPMPPLPVPGIMRPAASYVRVPGVSNGPTFGSRSTAAIAIPLFPAPSPTPNTNARTAVVQPTPNPAGVYRAGGASYRTAPPSTANGNATAGNTTSNELRPGMTLPDGSVVVSVGEANAPSLAGQASAQQPNLNPAVINPARINQAPQQPASPTLAPQSTPASNAPAATQSILEAEEIPKPAAAGSVSQPNPTSDSSTIKKF